MINFTGAKAIPYDMTENKDFSINPDSILSLINEKTRLLILNNLKKLNKNLNLLNQNLIKIF